MSQGGVPDPNLRASDADRERIVEQLRQHTAEGRLTMDEFEQRMSAAYAARTYGELAGLTRDLPVDLGARMRQGPGATGPHQPWSSPEPTGASGEILNAIVGAAMTWKMQKIQMRQQMRDQVRAQRRQARLARAGISIAAGFVGWAMLSVLLTGIWFMAGVTSSGGFGEFWPIWPIGIIGLLTALKAIKTVTLRKELTRR